MIDAGFLDLPFPGSFCVFREPSAPPAYGCPIPLLTLRRVGPGAANF
jgi:hypothetical protein